MLTDATRLKKQRNHLRIVKTRRDLLHPSAEGPRTSRARPHDAIASANTDCERLRLYFTAADRHFAPLDTLIHSNNPDI
jgi:hypothetical protein